LILTAINYFWKGYGGDETQQAVQGLPATITTPAFLWETDVGTAALPNNIWASPTICNLSATEPGNEVLIKANSTLGDNTILYALRGTDGTELWNMSNFGLDPSSPACADIDGDGLDEVITRTFGDGVIAVDGDGTTLWTNTEPAYSFSSPVVSDVDPSSPGPEVIITGPSGSSAVLWIMSATGTTLRTITISIPEQPAGTPAVGDIDGDGQKEVVVPTLFSGLLVIDPVSGSIEWTASGLAINQTPVIIDADADGDLDVVYSYNGQYVQILNGADGSPIWPTAFDIAAHTTIADTHSVLVEHFAVWDTDGDGYVDIFFGDGGDSSNVSSHLLRISGGSSPSLGWLYSIPQWSYDGGGALVDVDNDGDWDFLKTDDAGVLYALDANSGALVWSITVDESGATVDPAVAVGDIDGDNCSEVVVLGYVSGFLGGNYMARAIDQSGGGGSGCSPLGHDDDLSVSENPTRTTHDLVSWRNGVPYLTTDASIYSKDGRLIRRLTAGSRISLPSGAYYVVHNGRVKRIVIR